MNIKINDVEYELNTDDAIKLGCLKSIRKNPKIGEYYVDPENRLYELVQIASLTVALIDIVDGNRWSQGVKVNDVYDITVEELNDIIGKISLQEGDFKPVNVRWNIVER